MGVFLPFVSPWLTTIGARGLTLGCIAATRPLAGIVAPILFGWLADSLGLRGKLLRVACLGAFVPFAWLALRTVSGALPSPLELWIAIGISSFFRVPMMTLADVQALEKSSNYGSSRAWGSVGFMLATLATGMFLSPDVPSQFPLAVAATFLMALALSFSLPASVTSPQRPTRADVVNLLRHPSTVGLLLVTTVWATSHVAYDLCISLHLRDLGSSPLGTSFGWTLGVIPEILLISSWHRLKHWFPLDRWLLIGLAATALRWLALASTGSLTTVFWLQPLHALSFAVVWMTLMDLTRERAPAGLLATAQGLISTSCSLGATIGMVLFGATYGAWRGHVTFSIAATIALFATGLHFSLPLLQRFRKPTGALSGTAE